MILRKPMWGSEQAADIWALYYYLLYQTVPFEPKDYLPKDNNGYFYYENGERTSKRVSGKSGSLRWYSSACAHW